MKSILAMILLTVSVSSFSDVDTCPLHQDLLKIKDNFHLTLKAKKDFEGDFSLKKENSSFSIISKSISIKKGQEVPLIFMNKIFKKDELSSERSVTGLFLLDNENGSKSFRIDSITKVVFTIKDNNQDIPTVTDLHNAVNEAFEISCKKKTDDKKANSKDSIPSSSAQ